MKFYEVFAVHMAKDGSELSILVEQLASCLDFSDLTESQVIRFFL